MTDNSGRRVVDPLSMDETMAYLQMTTELSCNIVHAKKVGVEEVPELAEPTRYKLMFPAPRERAEGCANVYVEDFKELGLDVETEFIGEMDTKGPEPMYRIDILTNGVGESDGETIEIE